MNYPMKTRLLRPLTIMAFVAASTSALAQTNVNLLRNGSFERFTSGGIPDAWAPFSSNGTPARVSIYTRSGDYVLRLVDNSATASTGLFSASVPVTAGASYTAGASIKRLDTAHTTPSIYIKFYDSSGNAVGSASAYSNGAYNVWDHVTRTATAPSGAVTAKVLCYSSIASTGNCYFDGVFLRRNAAESATLRYVSPNGSGNGSNASNPASYNNGTFWNNVQSLLATQPVKVIFLDGDYVINDTSDRLVLVNKGDAAHRLILEGQRPFGSVFTRNNGAQASSSGGLTMVHLSRCQNIAVRHLHWECDVTLSDKLAGYALVANSGSTGNECRNITIEGCSFTGLDEHYYGALGIHHRMTHDVDVRLCEFVRGGHDGHFHMIYNSYGPSDLDFQANYFQDCKGAYLRLRADCHDTLVAANEFVSTASAYNRHFVEIATFNDVDPGDEKWGYNHTITDNLFAYFSSGSSNIAINLHHSGFDPYKTETSTWKYLIDPYYADALSGTNVYFKKSILKYNYDVYNGGTEPALFITDNVRQGHHTYKVRLGSFANYGAASLGGDGYYDISDVYPDN